MKKQIWIPLVLIGVLLAVLLYLLAPLFLDTEISHADSDAASLEIPDQEETEESSFEENFLNEEGGEFYEEGNDSGNDETEEIIEGTKETADETEDTSDEESQEEESINTGADTDYETEGESFDDIMVKVLSAILMGDFDTLSRYVGEAGLRLSPMGAFLSEDVILSKEETAEFFSRGEDTYGTFPGSGDPIAMGPQEYYERFICPVSFDFGESTVIYDDADDLEDALWGDYHTVRYSFEPNVMEWQDIVMVYASENGRDVLIAILHRDMSSY